MGHEPRRLISIASIVITLPLNVPAFPERGSAVTASVTATSVGGAFEVMRVAAATGVPVINLCPLGTGPNSMVVRQQLRRAGIESHALEVVGDTGLTLTLVEEGGYYTSIVAPGIEAEIEPAALASLEVRTGDVVYLSAGDLVHEPYRRTILEWLRDLPGEVTVVMAASPLAGQVSTDTFAEILPYCHVLTGNERELWLLAGGADDAHICPLVDTLHEADPMIVVRRGARGADLYRRDMPVAHVASLDYPVADTLGVGGTHVGVFVGSLMGGLDPLAALRRANVAGALAVSHSGGATDLDLERLDELASALV